MSNQPIIALAAPVAIQAGTKAPTFEATIYTGGALEVGGWDLPVVVDLAGLENGKVLVANLDHDSTKRVGNFAVANDGKTLKAKGTASAATPYRDEVIASAKAGYQWQASVEVQPREVEEVKKGKSVEANGQTFDGPLYVTRKGTLKGFAFVSHGADDNTQVSIAAAAKRKSKMENFMQWAESIGLDTSLMTAEQLAGIHANFNGRSDATDADRAAALPLIAASADPVAAENHRLKQIEAATKGPWGDQADDVAQLKAAAIGGELSIDELLQNLRTIRMNKFESTIPQGVTIRGGKHNNSQAIEAAFCLAGNLGNIEKHFPEPVLDHASRMTRSTGLQNLLMQAACSNGYQAAHAEGITQGNLRQVLSHAFPEIHATGFSLASVSSILSNVSNKFLFDGWQETSGEEWRKISEVKSVKDFKQATFYRLLESAEYAQVAPDGELQHGTLGEQSMNVTAATYGRMYAITRTDIINDDLGALTDIPRRLGRAAGMKFRRVFWGAFLATSDNFFHSSNGNVVTGSGTALTTAGTALQTALTAFRAMRTSAADGEKLIGGKPAVLMVPPALELVARSLLNSNAIVTTGTTDATIGNANVFAGLAELVVADWLSDSDLAGYSAAKWYLLRSPSIAPAMIVAFLNGQQSPTVETADADFNVLGIQMRGFHDWGVGRGEPLCGLQVAGTT